MKTGKQIMSVEPLPSEPPQHSPDAKPISQPSLGRAVLVFAVLIGITVASCHETSSYEIYTGPAVGGVAGTAGSGLGHAGSAEAGADSGGAGGGE